MGQCYVCSVYFQEEELKRHTMLYQDKITMALDRLRALVSGGDQAGLEATTLLTQLSELILHRGLEVAYFADVNTRSDDIGSLAWTRKSDRSAQELESTDEECAATQGTLTCPYEDCEWKYEFSREQDLLRHYALHYPVHETCCGTVFTQAKKYLSHKCRDKSTHKKRRRAIRQRIRERLRNMRRTGGVATETRPANSGYPAQEVTNHTKVSSNQPLQSAPATSVSCDQSIASFDVDAAIYFVPAEKDPSAFQSAPIYRDYSSTQAQAVQPELTPHKSVQAPIYSAVVGRASASHYHGIHVGQCELGNF
ncbi:hypothetical protein VTG60DRAFT_6069 [Thermothelomyces hinnuleus]